MNKKFFLKIIILVLTKIIWMPVSLAYSYYGPCDPQIPFTLEYLHTPYENQYDSSELEKWIHPIGNSPRAVALLIHGLNLRPSKMDQLAHVLAKQNIEVLRLSLTGHRGSQIEFTQVSKNSWLDETFNGYCRVLRRSKELQVPLYFVGYSLGASLMMDLFAEARYPMHVDKILLMAAAITPKWYTKLIKIFSPLGDSFVVPSFSIPEYQANSGTTMAAYHALFEIADFSQKALAKTHMPILYIIDPDDELVSYSDFQDLLEDYEDNSINFFEIQNNESQLEEKRHHLIITPQSLGQNEWNKMIIKILNFLLPSNDNQ